MRWKKERKGPPLHKSNRKGRPPKNCSSLRVHHPPFLQVGETLLEEGGASPAPTRKQGRGCQQSRSTLLREKRFPMRYIAESFCATAARRRKRSCQIAIAKTLVDFRASNELMEKA